MSVRPPNKRTSRPPVNFQVGRSVHARRAATADERIDPRHRRAYAQDKLLPARKQAYLAERSIRNLPREVRARLIGTSR